MKLTSTIKYNVCWVVVLDPEADKSVEFVSKCNAKKRALGGRLAAPFGGRLHAAKGALTVHRPAPRMTRTASQ